MKVRSLLVSMLCMLALSVSFASCSDDDDLLDDSGSTVALPQVRAFFLNICIETYDYKENGCNGLCT